MPYPGILMSHELRLSFESRFDAMNGAIKEALNFLDSLDVPPRAVYVANLALEEILTNIVKYAFPGDGSHDIGLLVAVSESEILLECIDDGIRFDPLSISPPQSADSILAFQEGGLGIHLLRKMVDKIEYRREHGRNILTVKVGMNPAKGFS
jgi:serine/threonine-protein kinase RsbW